MKTLLVSLVSTLLTGFALAQQAAPKLKVLLITGGHGFEQRPFFKVFQDNPDIVLTTGEHAKTSTPTYSATAYERDDLLNFDVVVLYDMPMSISEAQRAKFLSLFDKGVGVVVLHHALVSCPDWPEYEHIIGGHYPMPPRDQPQVTDVVGYLHNQEVPVVIVAKDHPITAGLKDFIIHDEIYWGFRVGKDVTPLLTTTHEKSGKPLAWTRQQGRSRLVYLQLGHDHLAWDNPNYPVLVARSIRWVAGKGPQANQAP